MRLIYTAIYYLFLPFILLRLFWKAREFPNYRKRWKERLGYLPIPKLSSSIWIHAVSLGETITAIPLIKSIKNHYPQLNLIITTTTATGSQRVLQTFTKNEVYHVYMPYDYPNAIKKFLKHINPLIVLIMETELWPNILYYCEKRNIPVLIANARISLKSANGYKKIGNFVRNNMLNKVDLIAAQSKLDAERYLNLGAEPSRVCVGGNIKFDIEIAKNLIAEGLKLRASWGNDRAIWIAASTHEGEEEQVLQALKAIKKNILNILLVLVPRHPERFQKVSELCKRLGFEVISYKKQETCLPTTDIVIGDTIGDLLLLYAASDVAFVGGSLSNVGGHNLLEPAALALPIITGNYLSNFQEISRLLDEANALIRVNNAEELANSVIGLFRNKETRVKRGKAGLKVIEQNKGALNKLMQWVESHLTKNAV